MNKSINLINLMSLIENQINNEYVYIIKNCGDNYVVSTATVDGWIAFHPPYLVDKDGSVIKMLSFDEADKLWHDDKNKTIYESNYFKEKQKHLKMPWDE